MTKEERRNYHAAWYLMNKERMKTLVKNWRKEHPEQSKEINKRWRINNRERRLASARNRDRARWPERKMLRDSLLVKRAGRPRPEVCEACGRLPGEKALAFDHDHSTGRFRGWLCGGCNSALGLMAERVDFMEGLIAYIQKHKIPYVKN